MTEHSRALPVLTVEALRRFLPYAVAHPKRVPATVIVVQAAPTALLLPYCTAAELAAVRGSTVPTFTARTASDLLLDLVLRADALHSPAAITFDGHPAIAIVPLNWADSLTPASSVAGPRTTTGTETVR